MTQFADLFKDCLSRFSETPEFSILNKHRAKGESLSAQDRQAIIDSVERLFSPLFDQIKTDVSSLTDSDLVFCVLSNIGIGATTIADCLTISPHTVRVRKHRLREKLPATWYDVFYGEEGSTVEVTPKRMAFTKAISHCFGNYFNTKGRAHRSEALYFLLFATIVILFANSIDDKVMLFSSLVHKGDPSYNKWAIVFHAICWIVMLWVMIPLYTVTVRRLHDLNCKAWPAALLTGLPCAIIVAIKVLVTVHADVFLMNKPTDPNFAFTVIYPIGYSQILLYILYLVQIIVFSIKGK